MRLETLKPPMVSAVVAFFLLSTLAALPAKAEGFYISASGGVSFTDAEKTTFLGDDELFHDVRYNPNTGLSFNGAIGYEGFFSDNMGYRVEAEGFYIDNNIGSSSLTLDDVGLEDLDGDENAFGVLGNVYLTFGGPDARITPYIGAGAGLVNLDLNIRHPLVRVSGNDSVFGYQFIAGLETPLSGNWQVSTEVRYLEADKGSFDVLGDDLLIPTTLAYASTMVLVKFRYVFDAD